MQANYDLSINLHRQYAAPHVTRIPIHRIYRLIEKIKTKTNVDAEYP